MLKRVDAREETGNVTLKSLFTVGQKKKRMFGATTWNKLGIDYYTNAHEKWKDAFIKTDPQYILLRNYWNKWIEDKGKKLMVGTTVGVKKSMHSILGTRDDRDLNKSQGRTKNDDESSNEDDDFEVVFSSCDPVF